MPGVSSRGRGRRTINEINMVPFIDVMLVLLIIFMVTAPLIQQGVKVNLPEARASAVEASDKKLVLSIDAQRRVYLGEAEVAIAELEQKLATNAKAQADKELYLHADRDVPYGVVVDIMAAAQRAGITNVGMITDPSANSGRSTSAPSTPARGKKDARR